ncbi:MAG: RiPP maturation radical SAM C-methyltransferase [Acidimicrobiia bacterium]
MRLCLVSMPWQSLDLPSLQLSLLSEAVRAARPEDHVDTYYANIHWAEYVLEHTGGDVTPDDYSDVVEDGLFHGLGDFVFTSALYVDESWPEERYLAHPKTPLVNDGPAKKMRAVAPSFIRFAADEVLAFEPDVVGLTSTFMQNVPSLALAAELKRRRPDVVVVMGGGNCDGPMGAALHRNFRMLDYVVSGEGERALVGLLAALEAGATEDALSKVGGLSWWRAGESVANPPLPDALTMDRVPRASFDDFFAAIDGGPVREYLEPKLVHEAARGCWWGARKHCTFCGLNGSTMEFRSKPPERVFAEIEDDVRRHRILDVVMVDNIMDTEYIATLLPSLAETGWDLRVHYEVKSNLRREHVRALADAGVVHIQPGIESLSTRVLKIMDKGVDGVSNVRLLRDCEDFRVTAPWNLLYGFPDEEPSDYLPIIEQMPNLHHLQPPRVATRIALERFSPYHQRPELGFGLRVPASFYHHVYNLPTRELMDLVFVFDTPNAGIGSDVERAVHDGVKTWQDAYFSSTLTHEVVGEELVISDRRAHRRQTEHVLREPWRVVGYQLLADGHGAESLARRLARLDLPTNTAEIEEWLGWLAAEGLVFVDAGRAVALATTDVPARVPVDHWR